VYQTEYARSAARLREAEDVLVRVAPHPDSLAALGRWVHDDLPDNSRIMGAFMAETIEREMGRPRLVATVGDPFAFWRTYREAALRTGGRTYALSDSAMSMLGQVERRHRVGGAARVVRETAPSDCPVVGRYIPHLVGRAGRGDLGRSVRCCEPATYGASRMARTFL
jgi:hypothetical protein